MCKVLHLGQGSHQYQYRLGGVWTESSFVEKDLVILVEDKFEYEMAMCTHSSEGQLYPGLHQKKRVQQVEGGDSAPLLL